MGAIKAYGEPKRQMWAPKGKWGAIKANGFGAPDGKWGAKRLMDLGAPDGKWGAKRQIDLATSSWQ